VHGEFLGILSITWGRPVRFLLRIAQVAQMARNLTGLR